MVERNRISDLERSDAEMRDTIYALASGAGPAGVAVVRVSGPDADLAVETLTGRGVPAPRRLVRRAVRLGGNEMIDRGLIAWFPGPGSFTGEDVAEFHLHGGRAVVEGALEGLRGVAGLRLAEPGEFTRRAFDNGKMDLTAAEGLADLVAARTAAQRRQALNQMEGALAVLYEGWRERLLRCLGLFEAGLDFSDEDFPSGLVEEAVAELRAVRGEMRARLNDRRRGEQMRDGFRVAIVGPPNVGKSSLLNRLAGRDVAIVSSGAGTTRDVLEVQLDLGGLPVTLTDTAGLREASEEIEAEGVRRARAEAQRAGLILAVESWDAGGEAPVAGCGDGELVRVWNKADLEPKPAGRDAIEVSAVSGAGLDGLLRVVEERVREMAGRAEAPAVTRARHREALEGCVVALDRALGGPDGELLADDVREAVAAVGRVTGRVDVEAMLDGVFREFCIGK